MTQGNGEKSTTEVEHPFHPILDLETGVRGCKLSGGFAQSVALARVLLRREAEILVLDEALGQMDAIKKREVIMPNIMAFCRRHGTMLLMVTHDVDAARNFDHIVVLSKGEIMGQGSHRNLQASCAEYRRLLGQGPPG